MGEAPGRLARYRPHLAVFAVTWIYCVAAYRPWLTHFYGDTWSLFNGFALAGMEAIFLPHNEHFLPVAQFILYWEFSLFGMNPLPYGLVSMAIHAFNAAMVFELAGRVARIGWARWFGALAYAMSGVLFETVTWEAAQEITISLAFGLAAHWLLGRFHDTGDRWRAGGAVVALACSLLSHSYGLALVPALALFGFALTGERARRSAIVGVAACLIAGAAYALLRLAFGQWSLGGPSAEYGATTSVFLLAKWVWLATWAGAIKPTASTLLSPVYLVAVAIPLALWTARRELFAGWRILPWIACMAVLPHLMAGAARIGRFGVESAVQGRYQYLPLAGLAVGVAWVVNAAWQGFVTSPERRRVAHGLLLVSIVAHGFAGGYYIRTHSVWYYHYRQVLHFLDRMVAPAPTQPPPGMVELSGELVLSHFACPYNFPFENALRIYGAAGWPVDPFKVSLREYLGSEAVRKQNLLAGRGLESGKWTAKGDARVIPLGDGKGTVAIELSSPDSSVQLAVEEFNDYKPLYTIVADASLAGGQYNTEMRLFFKDKEGAIRDQLVSYAFGKPEFLTIMVTGLAPLETRTVHVEFAPAMPGKRFCRTELRNVMMFRHPVFAPVKQATR